MRLRTAWQMMGGRSAWFVITLFRMLVPVHRVAWLAAAIKHDVLVRLHADPMDLDALATALDCPVEGREALSAWLRHGELLGELRRVDGRYALRGYLARRLALPEHAVYAAYVQGLVTIHVEGVFGALDHLRTPRSLAQLDHPLVAQVSELSAPLLDELCDAVVPKRGPTRMLEIGCGQARILRRAAAQNPELSGLGLDLDPGVAAAAEALVREDGLHGRVGLRAGDVRTVELDGGFDVITMFNLLYYLPPAERPEVVARVAGWLAPGGALVIAGNFRGGTLPNNMLDVWFSGLAECGPLPTADELRAMLAAAGLSQVNATRAVPGDEMWSFVARRASS